MDLLQFDKIEIESRKLSEYLLNKNHSDGFSKAAFFIAHGFDNNNLYESLLNHVKSNEPMKIIQTVFGIKYVIEEKIYAPDGFAFMLRSVWMKSKKNNCLKFVTAYPI